MRHRTLVTVFTLSLVALSVRAQSIVTFAGGGRVDGQLARDIITSKPRGRTVDGGPAAAASLQELWGLAIHAGFLYVSESGDGGNRVRRIDLATATITTYAGSGANPAGGFSGDGGPAVLAQLHRPVGLALDR